MLCLCYLFVCRVVVCCVDLLTTRLLLAWLGVLYRTNRSVIWMRFNSHEKVIELSGYGTLDVTHVHSVTVASNTMFVRSLEKPLRWASNVREAGHGCT